jgi:hypothetical protein
MRPHLLLIPLLLTACSPDQAAPPTVQSGNSAQQLRENLEAAADAKTFTVKESTLVDDRLRLVVDDNGNPPSSPAHWAGIVMTHLAGQDVTAEVVVNGTTLICGPASFRSDRIYLEKDAAAACEER